MPHLSKRTLEGILGTIIFHCVVAIIIMILKINSIEKVDNEGFIFVFDPEQLQEFLELSQKKDLYDGNEEIRRNIAVNKDQEKKNLSAEENLRRILESMKKFNEQAEDMLKNDENYDLNDELQERIRDRSMIDSTLLLKEENRIKKESEYYYEGPTNIYYSFENGNRQHKYLHIPVYKCEGSGKVTLIFDVNRDGKVVSSAFNRSETETFDECLLNAARESLLKTTFNRDSKAPLSHSGSITYLFVAQ